MTTSTTLRRLGVLERSRTQPGAADMLVLFELLSKGDAVKAKDHERRGAQVLIVQFMEP